MPEITLPFTLIVTLITAVVSVAMSWAVTKRTAEAAKETADAANKKAGDLERQLADFKVEAASRFVTDETLASVRDEVVTAINSLRDRLDRVIDMKLSDQRMLNARRWWLF